MFPRPRCDREKNYTEKLCRGCMINERWLIIKINVHLHAEAGTHTMPHIPFAIISLQKKGLQKM